MDPTSLVSLFVSCACNGSFGVVHKSCTLPNEIFVAFHCLGAFFVCSIAVPLLPLFDAEFGFTWYGLAAGFSQFLALQFVFRTLELAGVALATVSFAAVIISLSLLLELIESHPPSRPLLLLPALGLVGVGLIGAGLAQQLSILSSRAYDSAHRTRQSTTGALPELLFRTSTAWPERGSAKLLPVVDDADDAEAPPGAASQRSRPLLLRCGSGLQLILCILAVGIFVVASNALEAKAPERLQGISFAWSFGLGMLACSMLAAPLTFVAVHRRLPDRSELGGRRDAAFGVLCGILWGAAWCGIDVATAAGISQAVALSLFQGGSIFVAGCWGVWLRELFEPRQICLFFIACAWLEAGVVLETQASPSASPQANHTH